MSPALEKSYNSEVSVAVNLSPRQRLDVSFTLCLNFPISYFLQIPCNLISVPTLQLKHCLETAYESLVSVAFILGSQLLFVTLETLVLVLPVLQLRVLPGSPTLDSPCGFTLGSYREHSLCSR